MDDITTDLILARAEIATLTARAEQAERERDAAIAKLYKIAACDACKHYEPDKNSCAIPLAGYSECCFEWRGTERSDNADS